MPFYSKKQNDFLLAVTCILKDGIKYRRFLSNSLDFFFVISFMSDMNPTALIFGATGLLC